MGKLVNVVLWDGTVRSVDEDVAKQLDPSQARRETLNEQTGRAVQQINTERSSGFVEGAKASAEGMLDALSFGTFGAAVQAGGGDWAENMRVRGQERPGARLLGESVGYLAPWGAASGAAAVGHAAEGVAGKAVGRLVEGAMLGAGGKVAEANVTGDPLTVEGVVAGAGVGGLLNYGMGVLGDRLVGAAGGAKEAIAKEAQEAADQKVAVDRGDLLSNPPPSYKEAVETTKAARKTIIKATDAANDAREAYEAFANSRKMGKAIDNVGAAIKEVRSRYGPVAPAEAEAGAAVAEAPVAPSNGVPEPIVETPPEAPAPAPAPQGPQGLQEVYVPRLTPWGEEQNAAAQKAAAKAAPEAPVVDSRPPISPELDAKLKAFSARQSDLYKKWAGGWELTGPSKWKLKPGAPADPVGALEDLRQLQAEFRSGFAGDAEREATGGFPKASIKLTDLPAIPASPPPIAVSNGVLPTSLKQFTRMHADSAAALADDVAKLEAAGYKAPSEAWQRLASDLGVESKTGSVVADMHQSLGEWQAALDRLSETAAKEDTSPSIITWARKATKKAVQYAAGREVDSALSGGAVGAIGRSFVGGAVGAGMGAAMGAIDGDNVPESAALGAALVGGKATFRTRIREIIANYGARVGARAAELGPLTAALATSFPSGRPDPEPDDKKRAVNRIGDVVGASMTGPDAAFVALENAQGHPSDIAWKAHQQIMNALQHLTALAPKDPGTNTNLSGSAWTPTAAATYEFAARLEAVVDPLKAIARSISGDGHPAAADTLWRVWPAMMSEAAAEASMSLATNGIPYEAAGNVSRLFRVTPTGIQQQQIAVALQGLYLPKAQPAGGGGGGGSAEPSLHPTGRPPAVSSKVAGSSVAGLISN